MDNVRGSLVEDLKDIFTKFGWVAAFALLLTTGAQAYVADTIKPYQTLYEALALNVPMVLSATVLAMLAIRRWQETSPPSFLEQLWMVVAAICIPYAIAWLLGLAPSVTAGLQTTYGDCPAWNFTCSGPVVLREPDAVSLLRYLHPMHALRLVYDILMHYFAEERLAGTLTALAAGAFLAWVYEFKLLPRVRTQQGERRGEVPTR